MEEFGTNPDIDEKPPIPLREALEKMKPFLMVYEGIESQEEWEVRPLTISHTLVISSVAIEVSPPLESSCFTASLLT